MDDLLEQEKYVKAPMNVPKSSDVNGPSKKQGERNKKRNDLSGWEEDFQEPEITMEETAENQKLYSLDIPIIVRMERFIQKYRRKRKWNDASRYRLFTMYLALGGVSTGQKGFTGGLDLNENDDAQVTENQTAVDYIQYDLLDEYDVDFAWVVAVFLSSHLLYRAGVTEENELRMASQLVQNFLKSVLHNKVVPEHEDNVQSALNLAIQAEKELIDDKKFSVSLPGPLQRALSYYFVDNYKGLWDNADVYVRYTQPSSTAGGSKEKGSLNTLPFNSDFSNREGFQPDGHVRFSTEQAKAHITKVLGSDALEAKVVDQEYLTVELMSKELIHLEQVSTLCNAKFAVWNPPGTSYPQQTEKKEVEILFEPELIESMALKTHLEASFTFLSNDITIMDTVLAVLPTFYEEVEE
ncbi:argonaute binding protein 1 [Schizosaccharomyces cryophilus OY26]|uniref:Argonaute binding protein 1 n=1 Tax=Schizosaccharomyces cryophilus (strain OY26 / ATCC MYA-4695 / CBS 11777 / NBRC 106824 / NRRL Y48691) TaxID=653667 RepID=S9VYS7_SCHCR|nr:argonaute binding protein 1 [Schizosaccharomyces cryophilus OY26]EPY52808.1 argonaute binding protein 1 [Schizosaccharomyces cryophilus OY26]